MPYLADTPLTPEQEEELALALRGGLKGRFASSFSVLQGGIDALERSLMQNAKPAMQMQIGDILRQMQCHLTKLERLAETTADLALRHTLGSDAPPRCIELVGYLQKLCGTANEELERLHYPAQMCLQAEGTFYTESETGAVNALFAQLLSNSVKARADAHITLRCAPDGTLLYTDDGPGLAPQQRALLQNGMEQTKADRLDTLGLLAVAAYAAELGWKLDLPETSSGFALSLCAQAARPPQAATLQSTAAEEQYRAQQLTACLRREFTAALPPR